MTSDWRIHPEPLSKYICSECGALNRAAPATAGSMFADDYRLYAHAPGHAEEAERQRRYAQWLLELTPFDSVFEAGAGNGSLLLELRKARPDLRAAGIEPSDAAASQARASGLHVETAFLQANDGHSRSDVAVAINVIEHVPDPLAFIQHLRTHTKGRIVVVCPDGRTPSSELLISDHLHSFTPAEIAGLFQRAGCTVESQHTAPSDIGPFFATVATASADQKRPAQLKTGLFDLRASYLQRWAQLDRVLCERLEGLTDVVSFGMGEAAALLRCYAPNAWGVVKSCAADRPTDRTFGPLPVEPYSQISKSTILLAVRPPVQAALAERLLRDGHEVVRWDDVISV